MYSSGMCDQSSVKPAGINTMGTDCHPPWLLILHYCHFRPISQLKSVCVCVCVETAVCVCANRKIESNLQLKPDYSLIHYAGRQELGLYKWALNYVKQHVWERGDLPEEVTIRSGDQVGHDGDDDICWSSEVMSGSQGNTQMPESIIWLTCGSGLILDYCLSQSFYTVFVFLCCLCSVSWLACSYCILCLCILYFHYHFS